MGAGLHECHDALNRVLLLPVVSKLLVRAVPGCGRARDVVTSARAVARVRGGAQAGRGPCVGSDRTRHRPRPV